eukprot:comp17288_c0_seq1/m.28951 comp17288_c0_seq1/g.28951  ORF comp17288_c0_seq1/g.28951 comp17288_c0_seq1/m.28951 type:complete len:522 (-) comp17288_c0_seq1:1077-2642(-)
MSESDESVFSPPDRFVMFFQLFLGGRTEKMMPSLNGSSESTSSSSASPPRVIIWYISLSLSEISKKPLRKQSRRSLRSPSWVRRWASRRAVISSRSFMRSSYSFSRRRYSMIALTFDSILLSATSAWVMAACKASALSAEIWSSVSAGITGAAPSLVSICSPSTLTALTMRLRASSNIASWYLIFFSRSLNTLSTSSSWLARSTSLDRILSEFFLSFSRFAAISCTCSWRFSKRSCADLNAVITDPASSVSLVISVLTLAISPRISSSSASARSIALLAFSIVASAEEICTRHFVIPVDELSTSALYDSTCAFCARRRTPPASMILACSSAISVSRPEAAPRAFSSSFSKPAMVFSISLSLACSAALSFLGCLRICSTREASSGSCMARDFICICSLETTVSNSAFLALHCEMVVLSVSISARTRARVSVARTSSFSTASGDSTPALAALLLLLLSLPCLTAKEKGIRPLTTVEPPPAMVPEVSTTSPASVTTRKRLPPLLNESRVAFSRLSATKVSRSAK